MNSVWKGIKLVVVLKMLYFAYKANTLSKRTCVCRFLQYCRKVFTDFFKCLCIWSIWLQIIQVLYNIAGVWLSCWVTMSWKKYPVQPPIFSSTNWPEYQSQIKQIPGKMNKWGQCQEKERTSHRTGKNSCKRTVVQNVQSTLKLNGKKKKVN